MKKAPIGLNRKSKREGTLSIKEEQHGKNNNNCASLARSAYINTVTILTICFSRAPSIYSNYTKEDTINQPHVKLNNVNDICKNLAMNSFCKTVMKISPYTMFNLKIKVISHKIYKIVKPLSFTKNGCGLSFLGYFRNINTTSETTVPRTYQARNKEKGIRLHKSYKRRRRQCLATVRSATASKHCNHP